MQELQDVILNLTSAAYAAENKGREEGRAADTTRGRRGGKYCRVQTEEERRGPEGLTSGRMCRKSKAWVNSATSWAARVHGSKVLDRKTYVWACAHQLTATRGVLVGRKETSSTSPSEDFWLAGRPPGHWCGADGGDGGERLATPQLLPYS